MFTDADLSAPMVEAGRLFAAIANGADIAIEAPAGLEKRTPNQFIASRCTGRFFGPLFQRGLPDGEYGCRSKIRSVDSKAFTRAAAQTVFQLQTIERWGFDPEILFIAIKRGFSTNVVST